jgi:precorrin-2/cobalt-factor-2 C20-methyltransferase
MTAHPAQVHAAAVQGAPVDAGPVDAGHRDAAPVAAVTGTLYGVGLGPGDPDLVTLKAARCIAAAPVVAYFAKAGRLGNARAIVAPHLRPGTEELALAYPVTTEIPLDDPAYAETLAAFYATAAEAIAGHLAVGRDVALLAEGDPLFYGSFMHMLVRLRPRFPVAVIPGVTGMSGCWSAAGLPITWGDDVLTVLPGTLAEADLAARLAATDAAVVMKIGRNLPKVRRALAAAGLLDRAVLAERGTMAGERIRPLAEVGDEPVPYFSLVLVAGEGRRP